MAEKYQLPPGKNHSWRVTVRGKRMPALRARSWYYAREKAVVDYKAGHHEVEVELTAACRKRGHRSSWIRQEKRLSIYDRDHWTCIYCEETKHEPKELTLDHIHPRSKEMNNHATNLVTACRSCNSSKQNKGLKEWCEAKGFDYQAVRRRIHNARKRVFP